ncbi:cytochrome-c peroxidase [Thalassomonas haliotis]|uniref:C-type cytochrome n=1 Tax=Thalassomonas haliotis TaxID=485448 RepID=A0ABY7VG68_9GAMM|nr:cytochrome c peroxidase [Thalassomonas haliotis]WDE12704.1 c-type cytochrome [Thalassomonas haliotis]
MKKLSKFSSLAYLVLAAITISSGLFAGVAYAGIFVWADLPGAAPDVEAVTFEGTETAVNKISADITRQIAGRSGFILSSICPASFELTAAGECNLVTRYQFYDSVQQRGVGGTQTALPKHRSGFTPQQIDLGRYLFFDPLLSKDGTVSCASCHHPELGFSDGRGRSIGIGKEPTARGAPSLWNMTFLTSFFWDARANSLEQQAQGPLFDEKEMANSPEKLLASIRSNAYYPAMFAQAFPDIEKPTLEQLYTALAAFQSSLISLNSRYDQYAHGFHQALTADEIAGLNVFRSFVARCAECHQPPLFTNNQVAVIGTPEPDGLPFDSGAEKTFNSTKLRGGFKVPSLRNIGKTAPYMHSGRFEQLGDAVAFYNKGRGHALPENEQLQLHWHIWEPNLTDEEIARLVDFLGTLTDESLLPEVPQVLPSGLMPVQSLPLSEITKEQKDKANATDTVAAITTNNAIKNQGN